MLALTASHCRSNRTDHGCELHGVGAASISFSRYLPDSCANGARRAAIAACFGGARRATGQGMGQDIGNTARVQIAANRKRPLRRRRINKGGRQIRFEAVRQSQGDAG